MGYLAVFSRDSSRPTCGVEDIRELEQLTQRRRRRSRTRGIPRGASARRSRRAHGLHNRRYFHETLARESRRAHRYNRRLALIVFDLDDFKLMNDTNGHLAGDAVLAEAAGGCAR